ncbi:serine hydrolase domain-containing protein [Bryobacter aggregatus]|uniref:serine hydrolase domain-containing protein n=1 Tax=Bryobacter aggregatus TaxID=360054 RepID=UPI0004E0EA58|nr:serine hydrolase domain-containing protein [Bryobacter aggregatus]
MPMTRRGLVQLAAAAPFFATRPMLGATDDLLRSQMRRSAGLLGLPGFIAGVVRDGRLSFVQADGFADLESQTPMRQDHIFYLASLTKTFSAVMMMQLVQEKKISLDDYVLDYPFLSLGLTPDRLVDPEVKLKHILSHSSQGKPGDNFVYSGSRYNFVYGVFEKLSGNTNHYLACAQEFRQRVEEPLGMTSTLAGYPADIKDRRIARIATPYFLDAAHPTATRDGGASGATTLFPSTGLLSTVDDLSKYMTALDENALLSSESYARLTTPYTLNDGRLSPYGLGWSTQTIGGHALHWHYGYGDSYSALLVRVPEKKTSFIFLSNTGAASAPFLLGYGNLLTSPFAVAFLDSVLPGLLSSADRDFSEMFLLRYTEAAFGRHPGEAKSLLRRLCSTAPARFQKSDGATIHLLSELSDPAFSKEMDSLAEAYREAGAFCPETSLAIADYYGKTGKVAKRDVILRQIADRTGYGEERATRDACVRLGTELLRSGKTEEGRKYLWMAARYAKTSGESIEAQERIVRSLKL